LPFSESESAADATAWLDRGIRSASVDGMAILCFGVVLGLVSKVLRAACSTLEEEDLDCCFTGDVFEGPEEGGGLGAQVGRIRLTPGPKRRRRSPIYKCAEKR
jgi:hypothetical protein